MRRVLIRFVLLCLAVSLAGCAGAPAQPLAFMPAPWRDGETSVYVVLDRDGDHLGTATWIWQQQGTSWVQSYSMELGGRLDQGEVVLGEDLYPQTAWRELAGTRFEAAYTADKVVITKTIAAGDPTTQELRRPADALDNDQTLQVQRAMPLAAGYVTRYTDVIPTTGVAAPVKLSVTAAETITVPAGTFATWHTVMAFSGGSHDAWYAQKAPYWLVKYRNRASGSEFLLASWQSAGISGGLPAGEITAASGQAGAPEQTAASISVPFVVVSLAVQLPLMVILPLLLGWRLRRKYGTSWAIFGAGALTFVASQLLHLPANWALGLLGQPRGVGLWPLPALALAAGLSAGIFEECMRWLVLRLWLQRARGWSDALQFGAGHGGVEAIILGALAMLTLVANVALLLLGPALTAQLGENAGQVEAIVSAYWSNPWYMPLLAGLERVFALTFHIAMSVLVMRSVTRRQLLYLLAAVAGHTLLDAWAVWANSTLGIVWTEAGLGLTALACFWLILALRETTGSAGETVLPAPQPGPVPAANSIVRRQLTTDELARRAEASRYE